MEVLLTIAVVVAVICLVVSDWDGEEHPGWRGIPKPSNDGWKDRPPTIDRKSWKQMQRRSEQIRREVRKRPPDFGGGAGGDSGRGGGDFGGD
jgi:broad specificity phosphatase PhoE